MSTPTVEEVTAMVCGLYDVPPTGLALDDVRRYAELHVLSAVARSAALSGAAVTMSEVAAAEALAAAARESLHLPQRAIVQREPITVEFVNASSEGQKAAERRRRAREAAKDQRIRELEQQLAQRAIERDRPAPAPQPERPRTGISAYMGAVPTGLIIDAVPTGDGTYGYANFQNRD
jgi:hypothetical protein